MSEDTRDPAQVPAVQPTGASCGGRSAPSCLLGRPACTNTAPTCNALGMHLHLVTDPSPAWIIGEDASSGDAWLVHNRPPRFVASVCHQNAVAEGEDIFVLDCGLVLTQLRWLGAPSQSGTAGELIEHADRILGAWLQRQITRASRAA